MNLRFYHDYSVSTAGSITDRDERNHRGSRLNGRNYRPVTSLTFLSWKDTRHTSALNVGEKKPGPNRFTVVVYFWPATVRIPHPIAGHAYGDRGLRWIFMIVIGNNGPRRFIHVARIAESGQVVGKRCAAKSLLFTLEFNTILQMIMRYRF